MDVYKGTIEFGLDTDFNLSKGRARMIKKEV